MSLRPSELEKVCVTQDIVFLTRKTVENTGKAPFNWRQNYGTNDWLPKSVSDFLLIKNTFCPLTAFQKRNRLPPCGSFPPASGKAVLPATGPDGSQDPVSGCAGSVARLIPVTHAKNLRLQRRIFCGNVFETRQLAFFCNRFLRGKKPDGSCRLSVILAKTTAGLRLFHGLLRRTRLWCA